MDEEQNNLYIEQKINPIFEQLVTDLLFSKPDDVIEFMQTWISTKGQEFAHVKTGAIGLKELQKKPVKNEESGSEDDEEDDEIDDIPPAILAKKKAQGGRSSVSAEVFGLHNKKGDWKPRVIPKSEDAKQRILKRISQAFMFSGLDDKEREIVINAMEEKKFSPGEFVIKQGEEGDVLYVVDGGALDCYKKFPGDQEPRWLKTYQPGESFGELALLYNAPRAASIKAKTDSILWALDRETFNRIVKDAAAKKREKFEDVLSKVELLKEMDAYERSQIADALVTVNAKKGEYVMKQGDTNAEHFFMIESGTLVALKSENGGPEKEVYQYSAGGYFGELALLKNIPRQASIKCTSDCSLVALDRQSFKRMMGPLDDILKRNMALYEKYK